MCGVGVGAARMRPPISASKFPLVCRAVDRRAVERVDHDVDPDRRLLAWMNCASRSCPSCSSSAGARSGSGSRTRRRASSRPSGRTACTGPSSRRTRRCSPAGSACSSACVEAAEDDLVQRVAVDRLLERLPQLRARRERRADVRVRQVADAVLVADVDADALPAELGRLDHPQARGLLDAGSSVVDDAVEHLDVARLERRRRRRRVGHRLEDDLVEVDVASGRSSRAT